MSTIIVTHGQTENWHQVRPAGVFRRPGSFTGKFTQPKSAGAAILNMLRPGAARKFSDYANQVFILLQLQHVNRMDVVWD